jgi:RHH-type proline utilization regulon transcriptional repressor/proline dehydrogenase/delta 1-pyrroline-5-carboxylate dehydrogenase
MPASAPRSLSSSLYADEAQCVDRLLDALPWDRQRQARVREQAAKLVTRVRETKRKTGELESFLQQYGLNTEEGLALMTLAEALLRIPDPHTANLLIRDKMIAADWLASQGESKDWLVKAAGFGLSLTRKTLDSSLSRLGEPVIRKAMVEALRMLGRQFVLGRTIDEAIKNGRDYEKKGYRLSYDMLGEGARTFETADQYFDAYANAIKIIAASAASAKGPGLLKGKLQKGPGRPGISVKLSALHPRYEYRHAEECVPALSAKLGELARLAAQHDITLTVDAEEVDRLESSLKIIRNVASDPALKNWEGFGVAIQAYSKRSLDLVDVLAEIARDSGRRLQVRLVKGAYWDAEIKRAQVMGLPDYPLFTRKANTDLSFLACAHRMLERRDVFYPMFATHNAYSVTAIIELAGSNRNGYEFQRLHGMGETLHDLIVGDGVADSTVYAPCGSHEDLLPYLVRRLLENGASTSFVHKILDPNTPVETLTADPVEDARNHAKKRHTQIPLPRDIYGPGRANAAGMDLTEPSTVQPLLSGMKTVDGKSFEAAPLIDGQIYKTGTPHPVHNPAFSLKFSPARLREGELAGEGLLSSLAAARSSNPSPLDPPSRERAGGNHASVGQVWSADRQTVEEAFKSARQGFAGWSRTPASDRAAMLRKLAELMETERDTLMGLCVREAGKTIDDALAELREAVDFCRYYAMRGETDFADSGLLLPGPTGESNRLTLQGRGVFVCISPWNFPLAIFTGQIAAALMAGNAVIAKPAEQTPLIAAYTAGLIHKAGVPANAFHLLPGDGAVGAMLTGHKDVAGVAFTGSTEVARAINRTLAAKDGPIVPLIAETGGQNAMIVDSSALPEQVIDDVLVSAFGSSGQRCSALRVLYVQEEVADRFITLLKGAMATRKVGDPMLPSSDTGPVIDQDALRALLEHKDKLDRTAVKIAETPANQNGGTFFAPIAYEIKSIRELEREVFGPVLHVIRFAARDIDTVIGEINATGYGLTMGLHTRISTVMDRVTKAVQAGNIYVNRTMTGAVVGVQPFGGLGLSGTGPKAGGPHYLYRFATEKVISIDTTRQGGNATLVTLEE